MKIETFVLDDDEFILETVDRWFRQSGITDYRLFDKINECLSAVTQSLHIAIVDYKLGGAMHGIHIVEKIRETNPGCYFGLFTGFSDFKMAARFTKTTDRGIIIPKWNKIEDEDVSKDILIGFIRNRTEAINIIENSYADIENKIATLHNELQTMEKKVDNYFNI